ncbi:MAG: 1-acyl-sn-glycerol-3-phosphate acyltransferase, partial [Planctomycetota bacterium]
MPFTYRIVVFFFRCVVRIFFRRVEVIGLEELPREEGGGILVSWHPNGMVDPGLILTHFPNHVVFGARHGLFKWPGLGIMLRAIGTVPIYRRKDLQKKAPTDDKQKNANRGSLDALAKAVVDGRYSCLFPEGDSHDLPTLLQLKTGAARFYYRARELDPTRKPSIVPVGLFYNHKRAFRSDALVVFHPPIEVPEELHDAPSAEEDPEGYREHCRALTQEIDRTLREVVHATESWELHYLMHRARKLVRAERALRAGKMDLGPTDMEERTFGFARVWAGYYTMLETNPEEVAALVDRTQRYDDGLRALGLHDHELDHPPRLGSKWLLAILLL